MQASRRRIASTLRAGAPARSPGARGGTAIFTLPNVLTLLRLASAPVFLALFLGDFFGPEEELIRLSLCLGLVVLSEASDMLDGFLARRRGQVSEFGKLMDPYADSAFRLTVLFSFAGRNCRWVPLWMVVVLLYRDILTSVVRTFAMRRGVVVAARLSGKLKAVAEAAAMVSILVVAIRHEADGGAVMPVRAAALRIMWVVLAVAIWSGLDYFWACRRHLHPSAPAGPGEGASGA